MNQSNSHQNYSVLLPSSILNADRYELSNLPLHIEGQLPDDLQGHFFLVAPVGSVDSGGLPYPSGDSLLNSDGMIYRLDFDPPNEVNVKTKLVKPADYYADLETRTGSQYANYGFRNHGVTRFSISLGLRNELNTAFLPMPFSSDSPQRLLITYDAGRPYEIDTETLETVTPVGSNAEWQPEITGLNFVFPPFLSSAHPEFDAYTGEMFTVNYGRSVQNFLQTIPLIFQLEKVPKETEELVATITGFFSAELIKHLFQITSQVLQVITYPLETVLENISGIDLANFVYLVRWNGKGNLERWKVVLPDGSPIRIEQTMHQIGMSKDYIILMDTAFITGLEQVMNNPFPEHKNLEATLRDLLEKPENPNSAIYIVSRRDLKRGQFPAWEDQEVEVTARKLTIPMEAAHFLTDYENPDGQVTIHVAHICAWDVAEWIRSYDVSAYKDNFLNPERILGMETNEMDIGRLGKYVIDGETGELIQSKVISEAPYTWGNGLYAYLDRLPSGLPPSRLENIYWSSFGVWPELITEYGVRLYKNYPYRRVPITELLELGKTGVPSCLLRVDTTNLVIADHYEFPAGTIGNSPQFIPRQSSNGGSTDGYLICTVFSEDKNEFWVFDGKNLNQGPICKLSHSSLNFGFTLHTTWLPTIGKREASYNIPVNLDYKRVISEQSDPMIRKLFEQKVYPHFTS